MTNLSKIIKLLQMAVENENWEIVQEVIQLLFDMETYGDDVDVDDLDLEEW